MKRDQLIKHLVARKLQKQGKMKAVCLCVLQANPTPKKK